MSLGAVLSALGDPTRLQIVRILVQHKEGKNCTEAAPFPGMARSTLSSHFRILREAGLIHTEQKGVEHISTIRSKDLDARFPGLLDQILSHQ